MRICASYEWISLGDQRTEDSTYAVRTHTRAKKKLCIDFVWFQCESMHFPGQFGQLWSTIKNFDKQWFYAFKSFTATDNSSNWYYFAGVVLVWF